jgi:peptide/nickel transport system substrate-binding protein
MSGNDRSSESDPALTRREVLSGAAGVGAVVAFGGLLAGCGGGAEPGGAGAPVGKATRRGGTLRVGCTGGGAVDTLDAHAPVSDVDVARVMQLYEPLTEFDPDFKLVMALAESVEPEKSPDVWTIRLRPGVEFHDGRTLTADDVLFSFQRILDPKSPKPAASQISDIDLRRSKKLDERTVRIHLTRKNATFAEAISGLYVNIVPTDYDPKTPVGTGPFAYKSFSAGQQSLFMRNSHYWRERQPRVDELVIIDFPDTTARVNALLGGQVDCISNLPTGQIGTVQERSDLKLLEAQTGNFQPFTMRVDKAPFDDVRVRQAMRLVADRKQIIEQALSGHARLANDLYSPFDHCYAHDIPQREQDLDQAKSLLAQAGRSDLAVELVTAPIFQGTVESAQVLAQQAKGAGINISVRKLDTGTFYGDNYLKWTFAQDYYLTNPYLLQAARSDLPTSPFNETHFNDPQYTQLINQALSELDEAKRCEILHEAQQILWSRGGFIVWGFSNQVDAYSTKIAGLHPSKFGAPLGAYDLASVGFIK